MDFQIFMNHAAQLREVDLRDKSPEYRAGFEAALDLLIAHACTPIRIQALECVVGQMEDYIADDYVADEDGENSLAVALSRSILISLGSLRGQDNWTEIYQGIKARFANSDQEVQIDTTT